MTRTLTLALGALLLVACNDDGGSTDATDGDTDTDTEAPARLATVSGTTLELLSPTTKAPEGLCARAVEPTQALDGGDLTLLGESTVGADGSYSISDIDLDEARLAIFIVITDCDGSNTVSFPTGTGIASETYENLEAGAELTRDAFWMSAQSNTFINGSLAGAGSTKTSADGIVLMFVTDKDSNPLPGATVSCNGDGCDELEAYYLDGDPSDGLFTTGETVNAATVAGLAVMPGAPVANYTAAAEGRTFSTSLFGSIPGLAAATAVSSEE